MKEIHCYLTFDGNCASAMKFYEKCLKAELHMMPFAEMQGQPIPPEAKDKIMHARLQKGSAVLMASDNMPGMPLTKGNNFSVSINCASKQEADDYFGALKEGGKVTMPLQDTFWGAYFGMVTDQFGIQWMFNYDKPR